MPFWELLVNIFGILATFFFVFLLLLLVIWIAFYILKEKEVLPERYFYKVVRNTALPMVIFLFGLVICYFEKEHYQEKIDEQKSIEKALEN